MNYGVVLTEGPRDWQILQQREGKANIHLSGCFHLPASLPETERVRVCARVVQEDTGIPVTPWMEADIQRDRFALTLEGIPAGGLYRVETCMPREGNGWSYDWAVRGDIRHHIGVGDLYVIAGQSNAKGFGREPANDPPRLGVHVFRQSGRWDLATHPLGDSTDCRWEAAQDRSVTGYSPYLSFGKGLMEALHYPIGLIQTSKGGSTLEQWNPSDGPLYQGLMEAIQDCGGDIRGVLWYQGCSDANEVCSPTYLERFGELVGALRQRLGYPAPFLTCQLNRQLDSREDESWNRVRLAQLEASRSIPEVYIVPTIDLSLSDGIHNNSSSVIRLGERLAQAALAWLYGKGRFPVPYLESARAVGEGKLLLRFAGTDGGAVALKLLSKGPEQLPVVIFSQGKRLPVLGFTVEEGAALMVETQRFVPGETEIFLMWGASPEGIPIYDWDSMTPCLASRAPVEG